MAEEFDLQPINSPIKGKFDLQPVAPDQGPKDDLSQVFTGPVDTRSGARKFLDAHPSVEWLLTGSSPQQEEMLKKEGINPQLQGPGIGTIPGFSKLREMASHLADSEKIQSSQEGTVSSNPDSNWWRGALASFLPENLLSPLQFLEGGFDPRTAGIKTGVLSPVEESLSQNLGKLKIPAADATVDEALVATKKANRPVTVKLKVPEPKAGEPPYNTAQFGLQPSSESLPYPLNVVPDRLRPPSTNATVFNALVPERYKLNAAGLAPTEELVKPTVEEIPRILPSAEKVSAAYDARKVEEAASDLVNTQSKLDSLSSSGVSPTDIKSETGALRLRGKSTPEVESIRSSLLKTITSGGKLNLGEMYQPYSGQLTTKQFGKIVDDILESGDLQRAYEGVKASNLARDTAPMQMRPTSLSDAISNLKNAVNQHITARATQDAMVAEEKAARAGKLSQITDQGVEGFSKKSQALKGEYSKVPMEPIKEAISQIDLDELMNAPEKTFTDQFQRYRAQNAIAKVFGITGDRTPLQPNEIKLLQQTFGNEMADQLAQLHGGISLVADGNPQFHKISELANLSKSIQASTDLSAPLRQGLPMLLRSEFYPAFAKMFKFAGSENSYKNMQEYLSKQWPERELARKSGLSISQIGSDVGQKEEHFLSGLPEKVPFLGQVYRGSERAYVGFIDKLRSDVFTSMIEDLRKSGIQTESKIKLKNGNEILVPSSEVKAVARYVNVATGRGSLTTTLPESLGGKTISAEKYGDLLNSVFYSPRFQASRIQLITDPITQWSSLPKVVRKEYLKSLLAVGGFVTTANGLGYALSGKLTSNPTSSDFGKIKSGPRDMTRNDPGAGWLQYITLASQLATNAKTNPVTGKTTELGEGYKAPTRGDIVADFARKKLAPLPQFAIGAFTGKNAIGQDFDATSEAAKLVIPLLAQDIYDVMKEDPSLASLGKSLPAVFGVGLNTFEQFKKKDRTQKVDRLSPFSLGKVN